jgi:hypothetical protein
VSGAFIQATELAFPQFQEEDAHLNTSVHDKAHTSRSTWQASTAFCDVIRHAMHARVVQGLRATLWAALLQQSYVRRIVD